MHMNLSRNLTDLCKKRGWSLARLSRASGVPIQTIHGWCVGRKAVRLDQLRKVAGALEVPVYQLAFGEPDPFENIGEEILKEIFSGDVRVTLHRIQRKKLGR